MVKSTFYSQLVASFIWSIVLAAAIALANVLPGNIYAELQFWIPVVFTFLCCGIRVFPYFENGIAGIFYKNNSKSNSDDIEAGEQPQDSTQEKHQPLKTSKTKRIYFLDYVKSFLTFVVLFHHTLGSFKSDAGMPIQIGNYENTFNLIASVFLGANQSYFMPLFFFISAYFTPVSYNKKGIDLFLSERGKRLFFPAFTVTFVLLPISDMIGQAFAGNELKYHQNQGPTWYIYWLMIFSIIYCTYRIAYEYSKFFDGEDSDNNNEQEENEEQNYTYPNFWKRWLAGAIVCGCTQLLFSLALGNYVGTPPSFHVDNFYMVPLGNNTGTFCHNVFFFVMGIFASKKKLLSEPILPSLSSWIILSISILIEYFIGSAMLFYTYPLFAIFMGMYCVDMSTLILAIFQKYLNVKPGKIGKFFSSAAYTVYLIHPFFLAVWMGAFVKVYNAMYGDVIQFPPGSTKSESPLLGPGDGSIAQFVGFVVVLMCVNLTVWPTAYCIRSLPILRDVL